MATLHLLAQSPYATSTLDSALRLLSAQDALLFTGDACNALQAGSAPLEKLQLLPAGIELFALEEDMQARNISTPARVTLVDYPGFVALSIRFDKVNSWL